MTNTDTIASLRERELNSFLHLLGQRLWYVYDWDAKFKNRVGMQGIVTELSAAVSALCDRLSAGAGEPVAWRAENNHVPGDYLYTADRATAFDYTVPAKVIPLYSAPADGQAALLVRALKDLIRAYVSLLETGRDRIIMHGGQCDSVDVMEAADPFLREARAALLAAQPGKKL
jgi:hypothetical protein